MTREPESKGDEGMTDYASPTIEEILEAVPMLQWRRCRECGHTGLYRDNMRPICNCRECGSEDTWAAQALNQRLHRIEDKP